jgi:hypothetical protein
MPPLTLPTQSASSTTLSPKPIDLTSDALIEEIIVQLWTLKHVSMDFKQLKKCKKRIFFEASSMFIEIKIHYFLSKSIDDKQDRCII